jgi:hypothetical protein
MQSVLLITSVVCEGYLMNLSLKCFFIGLVFSATTTHICGSEGGNGGWGAWLLQARDKAYALGSNLSSAYATLSEDQHDRIKVIEEALKECDPGSEEAKVLQQEMNQLKLIQKAQKGVTLARNTTVGVLEMTEKGGRVVECATVGAGILGTKWEAARAIAQSKEAEQLAAQVKDQFSPAAIRQGQDGLLESQNELKELEALLREARGNNSSSGVIKNLEKQIQDLKDQIDTKAAENKQKVESVFTNLAFVKQEVQTKKTELQELAQAAVGVGYPTKTATAEELKSQLVTAVEAKKKTLQDKMDEKKDNEEVRMQCQDKIRELDGMLKNGTERIDARYKVSAQACQGMVRDLIQKL